VAQPDWDARSPLFEGGTPLISLRRAPFLKKDRLHSSFEGRKASIPTGFSFKGTVA